jgi:uncharacterized protein
LIFSHVVVDFQPQACYIHGMIFRNLATPILDAMRDTPVIFLAGARQTGKSTLVQSIAGQHPGMEYLTLDDSSALSSAQNDPQGFVAGLPPSVVIDEVQRAPDLFRSIKLSVDQNRKPGRFFLTGSANVLVLPKLSESLAGRMDILTLWPFSQGELAGKKETFIDRAFSGDLKQSGLHKQDEPLLWDRIATGGFPEVLTRSSDTRREAWFKSYIDTISQRDIRDLAEIEILAQLPDLLKLLAGRISSLVNFADLSRSLQIPQTTLKRYLKLLEATFLIYRVRPWHVNISNRIVKAPKLYFTDSGLACNLLGATRNTLATERMQGGPLLENFVAGELARQLGWANQRCSLYFFRTHEGQEVDLILENQAGKCVGIEVKTTGQVKSDDTKGLRFLKGAIKSRFIAGIVLYTGTQIVPFDKDIHAMPVQALWGG